MHGFEKKGHLYKYRSLENLERVLSIIIDRKLYGALYKELNDPMEGYFRYDPKLDHTIVSNIIDSKQKTYICSLSEKGNIGLMWTHYANENKGCCIEVKVPANTNWKKLKVKYLKSLPIIQPGSGLENILKTKASMWKYEKEVRYISPLIEYDAERPQLEVEITRVLIGCNVERSKCEHLEKIIKALDPTIEIVKMQKNWLDYGYVNY